MKKGLRNSVIAMIEKTHFRIFKYNLSEDMKIFLGNMSYAGISSVITAVMLGILQIVAVRALGPVEYGKVSLVFTVANFVPYLMFMGIHSGLSKYLPEKDPPGQQGIIITTSMLGILFFTCLTLTVSYLARNYISEMLNFDMAVYSVGIIYCVFTVFKTSTESILRGLLKFKTQAILDVSYTSIAFLIFFVMYLLGYGGSYIAYICSFSAGLLIYSVSVLVWHKQYLRISFWKISKFKTLLSYGIYSVIGSIALFVLWGSDRFFISKYLDLQSVGIYSVYYGASLIILGRFSSILIKVLFPTASGRPDKAEINKSLSKLMFIGFIPLFLLNFGIMLIMLRIYGNQYPFNLTWVILFSINAILYTYINSRGTLLVSQGVKGYAFYSFWSTCMAIFAFILYLAMIPPFGITGAIIAVIIVSFIFFIGLSYYTHNLFLREKKMSSSKLYM